MPSTDVQKSTESSNRTSYLPFIRSSVNSQDSLTTQAPYSYSIPTATASAPALYSPPIQSRIPRAARLHSKCKAVLLKDFSLRPNIPGYTKLKPTVKATPSPRRPAIRMKDSDDYLTARAANPRTGLVSPSIAGTPCTSKSPAEALALRRPDSASPSHQVRTSHRPPLSHANEGRKVSGGNLQRWHTDSKGWFSSSPVPASPQTTDTSAGAADIVQQYGELREDSFILPMPSAREPQPYAYPGRSQQEIAAYEHYRRKSRKTSREGWDHRHVQAGGVRKSSGGREYPMLERDKTVIRRRLDSLEAEGTEWGAFAPYCSPKTPAVRRMSAEEAARPLTAVPFPAMAIRQVPKAPMSRKPIRARVPITHLDQLPQVRLVHPELASLPMPRIRPSARQVSGERKCSLDCSTNINTGACMQRTRPGVPAEEGLEPLFADVKKVSFADQAARLDLLGLLSQTYTHLLPVMLVLMASVQQASQHVKLPRPALISTLTSDHSSPEQKVHAARSLAFLSGQAIMVLLVISVVWKVATCLLQVLSVVAWPLLVPLKIFRWVVLGW